MAEISDLVGEQKRNVRFVLRVFECMTDDLQHRSDPCTQGSHTGNFTDIFPK